jgi:hypothetical protein
MAKTVVEITGDFTSFTGQWAEYCKDQGAESYDPKSFQWFRPEGVSDTSNLQQISQPYSLSELDGFANQMLQYDNEKGNSGDAALLMTQYDMIISGSRAFAERYRSKLRHFAHGAGLCDRLGNDYGPIKQGLISTLQEIKGRASTDAQ